MGDESADLGPLIDCVAALVGVLELDLDCPWLDGFRGWLREARAAQATATREDAVRLAAAVMRAFDGGMGGFNDYLPQRGGDVSAWAGQVHELGSDVFVAALSLRGEGGNARGDL